MSNPLLTFQYRVPFDQIRAGEVEPAIDELLAQAQASLGRIIQVEGERTYANTMQPFDTFTRQLEYAMNVVRHWRAWRRRRNAGSFTPRCS